MTRLSPLILVLALAALLWAVHAREVRDDRLDRDRLSELRQRVGWDGDTLSVQERAERGELAGLESRARARGELDPVSAETEGARGRALGAGPPMRTPPSR